MTFTTNLIKLQQERRGVIFLCGAVHADTIFKSFQDLQKQDQLIILFPHSDKRYEETYDDINTVLRSDVLKDRTFCISSKGDEKKEIASLADRVVKEIGFKSYKNVRLLSENTHSQFLSDLFKVKFDAYERGESYVDAALKQEFVSKDILERLKKNRIPNTYRKINDQTNLVISNVNTQEVAQQIRKIKI
jgi:hypothetical protein